MDELDQLREENSRLKKDLALAKRTFAYEVLCSTPFRYRVFDENNLPDPSVMSFETVVIPKEFVVQWRNDYALLVAFVSYVVGKPIERLCMMDLLNKLMYNIGADKNEESER